MTTYALSKYENTAGWNARQYNPLFGSVSQSNGNKNTKRQDFVKLKSLCTAKEIVNKMKRQPTEWEKIFANDVTNK